MSVLKRLFGRRPEPAPRKAPSSPAAAPQIPFDAPIAPDGPVFVVGDVHGRHDLMMRLFERIEQIEDTPRVVFVGDYVDRGEQSADVLRTLQGLSAQFGDLLTCLKGNHEAMMLEFLANPERAGQRWLRHGGLQTLASFRISRSPDTSMTELRDQLRDAMGQDLIDWVTGLPLRWQSGNLAVVHAGADPLVPMDRQSDDVLMWGTSQFMLTNRMDGIWVAHGHTIVRTPQAQSGRISTDTGAYATGRLTAAHIVPGDVRFIEAT